MGMASCWCRKGSVKERGFTHWLGSIHTSNQFHWRSTLRVLIILLSAALFTREERRRSRTLGCHLKRKMNPLTWTPFAWTEDRQQPAGGGCSWEPRGASYQTGSIGPSFSLLLPGLTRAQPQHLFQGQGQIPESMSLRRFGCISSSLNNYRYLVPMAMHQRLENKTF